MTPPALPPLPERPASYLWLYADVCAGDWTAVAIFLVGSVFSPGYAARPEGVPLEHSAVNFALYHRGRRQRWAFTEYSTATRVSDHELRIGRSTLRYQGHQLTMEIDERTAPWGKPIRARLVLDAEVPPAGAVSLISAERHIWEPRMIRAAASLECEELGVQVQGRGYHDLNAGEQPLGVSLPGWSWDRAHNEVESTVWFRLPTGRAFRAHAQGGTSSVEELQAPALATSRTAWGLKVPEVPRGGLLESSPFYARYQRREGGHDVLGEVADFRRFRSPLVRWMAHFRSRAEAA